MIGVGFAELALLILFGMGGGLGAPLGLPPGPEDPLMAKIAPEHCLFYTTWSPVVKPQAANNPTEAWMAQPEIQESFETFMNAFSKLADNEVEEDREAAELGLKIAQRALRNSVAIYLTKLEVNEDGLKIEGAAVADLGTDAHSINDRITKFAKRTVESEQDLTVGDFKIDGVQFHSITPDELDTTIAWGVVQDKYLLIGFGENQIQNILDNSKTPPPPWLVGLRQRIPVQRIASVTYANIQDAWKLTEAIPEIEMQPFFDMLGISQIRDIGWIAGLDDQGFVMRTEIRIDGEPTGLLGVVNGRPLNLPDISRIPDDKMITFVSRLSPAKIYEFANEISRMGPESIEDQVQQLNAVAEIDFKEDVIARLGDYGYVYGSISITNPYSGWVLAMGVDDEMSLTEPYDKIVELAKAAYGSLEELEFEESMVDRDIVYTLADKRGWAIPSPSWSLAKGELIFGLDKSSLRRHLRREPDAGNALINDPWFRAMFEPIEAGGSGPIAVTSVDAAQILQLVMPLVSSLGNDLFPEKFDFTFDDLPATDVLTRNVKDNVSALYRTGNGFQVLHRQTFPGGSPGGMLGGMAIVGMPMAARTRREASLAASKNNMRQLLLACHNYESATRSLPARFSKDDEDKPLLSWRVHILPFIEQQDLYEEFKLDEPWDSEHNRKLIERMPDVFKHPTLKLDNGKTVYLVPAGADSVMIAPENSQDEDKFPRGGRIGDITDGTSVTVLVVEANADNAVTWTSPADYNWEDPMEILDGLKGVWPDKITLGFADGSVQSFSEESLVDVIKLLFQKSDGQVLDFPDR